MTATFHLATERISKWSVVQLPRYSFKCMPHTWKYLSCKCNFWHCYAVPYTIRVTCLPLWVPERVEYVALAI